MPEQEKRGPGRPRKHKPGEVTKVTLELPVDLWQYITWHITQTASINRTQWIIEAIREKLERESKND